MAAQGQYNIFVRAIDQTTAVVARINKSLATQSKGFAGINKSVMGFNKELQRTFKAAGLDNFTKKLKELGTELSAGIRATAAFVGGFGALGGIASGAGLAALATKFSNFNLNLTNNARLLGVSAQQLELWQKTGEYVGITAETTTAGLKGMALVLQDAAMQRNPEAAAAYHLLGIEIDDMGNYAKNPIAVMPKLADKIQDMIKHGEGMAAVRELMAKLGVPEDFLPMLVQGSEGLKKIQDQVKKYATWTEDGAAASEKFRVSQVLLGHSLGALGSAISNAVNPSLTAMSEASRAVIDRFHAWFDVNKAWIGQDIQTVINDTRKAIEAIWHVIDSVVESTIGWDGVAAALGGVMTGVLVVGLGVATVAMWGLVTAAAAFAVTPIGIIIEAFAGVGLALYELWKHWDQITDWMQDTWDDVQDKVHAVALVIKDAFKPVIKFWLEGFHTFSRLFRNIIEGIEDKFHVFTDVIPASAKKMLGLDATPSETPAQRKAREAAADAAEDAADDVQDGADATKEKTDEAQRTADRAAAKAARMQQRADRDAKEAADKATPAAPVASGGDGAPTATGTAATAPNASAVDLATSALKKYEGYTANAKWDVNAYRAGYGSDTTTDATTGKVSSIQSGSTVNKADSEADLKRRVTTQFMPKAAAQIGQAAWDKLSPQAQAAITSVTYNYGHVPDTLIAAAKSGDANAIGSAISGLGSDNAGINAKRRNSEAQLAMGGGSSAPSAPGSSSGGGVAPIAPIAPSGGGMPNGVVVVTLVLPDGFKANVATKGTGVQAAAKTAAPSVS
jgi:GH24 family phage-related lysozyme (muramidase)/predicted PurR-regulated permease PerM